MLKYYQVENIWSKEVVVKSPSRVKQKSKNIWQKENPVLERLKKKKIPLTAFWLLCYTWSKNARVFQRHLALNIHSTFECPQQDQKRGIQFSKIIVSDKVLIPFQKQSDKYLITSQVISKPHSWAWQKATGNDKVP